MTTYYATLSLGGDQVAIAAPANSMSGAIINALNLEETMRSTTPALRGQFLDLDVKIIGG